MESDLHLRTNFKNPNIIVAIGKEIIEYDMKAAGFNIAKELGLLTRSEVSKLEKYDKHRRHIYLGEKERDNIKYRDSISNGFAEFRLKFIDSNDLDYNDIISIKKDAFFVTKECDKLKFGKYIEFVPKNIYSSYIRIDNKLELYYSDERTNIDVKGIDDDMIILHKDYMMDFFYKYFKLAEYEPNKIMKFLKIFFDDYRNRNIDINYYRTFDYRSIIEVIDGNLQYFVDDWSNDDIEDVDNSYNYDNVLLPLLKITVSEWR